MAAKINIVEEYARATIEGKVEIILEHYNGFEKIIEGFERCLSVQIRNEREFNRRKNNQDLDVRVQTSGLSDTTARIAIENVSIQEAIKSGDVDEVLKDTDDIEKHRMEIRTLINMRDDYVLVSSQILLLQGDDFDLYNRYLSKCESMSSLAEKREIEYDAVKKRVRRSKKIVMDQSVLFLQSKYKYA